MRQAVLALFVASSCSPEINTFNVTPLGYCATTRKIHVDWDTSHGDTTLQIEPPDQAPKMVASSGSLDLDPQNMTLTLTVSKGELSPHNVKTVRAVDRHTLNGFASQCAAHWVTTDAAQFGVGLAAFDVTAHPAVISNKCAVNAGGHATCRRHVEVIHGANTWDLDPDTALDVSTANAAMTGDWILKGQLLLDEQCGTASAADAKELDLDVEIGCVQ